MDIETFLTGAAGATGVGSLFAWAVKYWVRSVNCKMAEQDKKIELNHKEVREDLHKIQLQLAKADGQKEGADELVWREINTGKIKAEKALSSTDKLWVAVRLIGSKLGVNVDRTSDSIENMIEDSINKK